jgi:hypothetical protein
MIKSQVIHPTINEVLVRVFRNWNIHFISLASSQRRKTNSMPQPEKIGAYLGHAARISMRCFKDKDLKVNSIIVMILRQVQFQFFL